MNFFKWFKKSKNIKPPFREKTEIVINVSDAGDWSVGMPSTNAKFRIICDQKIDDEDLENLTEELITAFKNTFDYAVDLRVYTDDELDREIKQYELNQERGL